MPQKINMFLSNGNILPPQMSSIPNLAVTPPTVNSSLNNSMISRIHNVRPGCGSCGRKG